MAIPQTYDEVLHNKIKVLNETTWESKIKKPKIEKWLNNFTTEKEKTHALFLLSNFMYFGNIQIKQLLISLYRDLYKYPIIEKIRLDNGDTTDLVFIDQQFKSSRQNTRFLGIGNASESGSHLLYLLRQENSLPVDLFPENTDIFLTDADGKNTLRDPSVRHYVLFDDFCGSGSQAISYSSDKVEKIKAIDSSIRVSYLMLFSTKQGKKNVLNYTKFDFVEAVVEFDESFKFFNTDSRYFQNCPVDIDKSFLKDLCITYGEPLVRALWTREGFTGSDLDFQVASTTLGFGDCQLLLGFYHNTPDNTLPIIWFDEEHVEWYPIFKRYNKNYGS